MSAAVSHHHSTAQRAAAAAGIVARAGRRWGLLPYQVVVAANIAANAVLREGQSAAGAVAAARTAARATRCCMTTARHARAHEVQRATGLNSSPSVQSSPRRRNTRFACASTTRAFTPAINSDTSARQERRSSKVSRASTNVTPSSVLNRHRQPSVPVTRAQIPERRYTSTYILPALCVSDPRSYIQISAVDQRHSFERAGQLNESAFETHDQLEGGY